MKLLDVAALICRGVGLLLLVQGFVGAAGFLLLDPISTPSLPDPPAMAIDGFRASLPGIVEAICGVALFWFARPLGRLLARGISSGDA